LKNTSDAILIEGSILSDVEEETYHVLEALNERRGDRILVVALDGMSQNMINKLVFDYDAANLTVPVPKKKYYEERFMDSMEQEGAVLAEGTSVEKIVDMIRCFRAEEFGLNDFGKAIKKAVRKAAKEERQELVYRDFELFREGYQEPEERLEELIGLGKVKKKVARMAALRMFDDARLGPFHKHASYHVAFAGDPGTGKTEVARLYAQMLSKNGITNGIFISACKSDYIGIHVGKTADLMYKLFTRARNGVIFFDEAATFLTDDSFAEEALTELVRFMEMYTDVVCIFASYEDNINKLLEKDAGLKSRISEIIKFDNYSKEELYDILSLFCQKEQFQLEDARAAFYRYVEDQRRAYPDSFGNARLSRNVFNKAKEILAKETIESGKDPELVNTMTAELIDKALEELTAMSAVKSRNHFGFAAL
jgi:SpoVK/Ycf46/Vps4 family AAA+-type ATPase